MLVTDDTDWRAHAACATADPELFFPLSSGGVSYARERRAKAFCGICHVRRECLAFALETQQVHGVWGGLSERERARLARRRPADGSLSRERPPGPARVPGVSSVPEGLGPAAEGVSVVPGDL